MGWSATRNPNGSLHVVNDVDGSHFEAKDDAEVHEVIDKINEREQERIAAEQAAQTTSDAVNVPQGDVTRIN